MIVFSLPSRRILNWTVSPGAYSPIMEAMEPALPTLTPLISRTISLSLSPALSAGLFLAMAEYWAEL